MAVAIGLESAKELPNFEVDMSIHRAVQDSICLGCMATTTILNISKTAPTSEIFLDSEAMIRAVKAGKRDFDCFEGAVDRLRHGYWELLASYLGIRVWDIPTEIQQALAAFNIRNGNWESYVPILKDLSEQCRKAGI